MATFEAQVEGLIGITLSGSTNPTETQLTQFLNDAVIDVTNRCISLDPKQQTDFSRESAEQTSNGFNPGTSEIISVIRESGTDGEWYPCSQKAIGLQYRVKDNTSLYFASKYNPVYMTTQNRNVHVYPEPGSSNDGFKVLYVNSSPEEGDGTALVFGSSDIKWFPNDKVYLVVIYAAIKSLENAMAAKGTPAISGDGTELTDVSQLDGDNTIDVLANQDEIDQWWSTTGHLIEGAEDLEMASVQLQKISAYIQAYGAQLQGNNTDYGWMQGRHQILSKQYDTAFAMMRPPQPPQQRGR